MTIIDIIYILLLIGALLWGFKIALVRQLIGIAALYIALVIAALSNESTSTALQGLFRNMSLDALYATSFVLIVAVVTLTLYGLSYIIYHQTYINSLGIWDNVLGGFLGLIHGAILIGMIILFMRFAFFIDWGPSNGARDFLRVSLQSSLLTPLFSQLSTILVDTLKPWYGGQESLPLILGGTRR